jgi:hypothetical protein
MDRKQITLIVAVFIGIALLRPGLGADSSGEPTKPILGPDPTEDAVPFFLEPGFNGFGAL